MNAKELQQASGVTPSDLWIAFDPIRTTWFDGCSYPVFASGYEGTIYITLVKISKLILT